ncbi:unnamed protein product [Lactuca saligna]|uniref:Uncharacterized protein n=1 Tax=Lactuca saligna TaxID=75948 RepID=A0AA35Z8V8_LACSI|nr:unnamed protein product [Lactuca saligna]
MAPMHHTTHIKNVSFYEHNIFNAATKDPHYVTAWISKGTENINDHHLIIGLDTEWRASFYEHNIFNAATKDPHYVTTWISKGTEDINEHHLIIGLDTEWRASFRRGGENRIAILQLCVGHRCLIFQTIHAPYMP